MHLHTIWMDIFWEEDQQIIAYKKAGVGRGHSKTGQRRRWKKKTFFEQDLLTKFRRTMYPDAFSARFAGYTPEQVDWFFQQIKKEAISPKETEVHCRNKLLMWLDKLHNCLSYQQIKDSYQIGITTAKFFVNDMLKAILKSFENKKVVAFPPEDQKQVMEQILKQKGANMPYALFSVDGCHTRCTGRQIRERLSYKYQWLPCFSVTFIMEKVFGTVYAFNLDQSAAKHDITVLREA